MRCCHFKQTDDDAVFLAHIQPKIKTSRGFYLFFILKKCVSASLAITKALDFWEIQSNSSFPGGNFSAARVITSQFDGI